jgi:hypothetical protein
MRCRRRRSAIPASPYCATGTAVVTQTGQAGGTYSSTTGLVINAIDRCDQPGDKYGGHVYRHIFFSNGTCSNTTTTAVTINALPTATIAYGGSPYCATGTATVTQTGTSGGTYSSTTGLSYQCDDRCHRPGHQYRGHLYGHLQPLPTALAAIRRRRP